MTSTPIRPDDSDKDPIWGIFRTYPIIDANNDGTIFHEQWQAIIDALNFLLASSGSSVAGGPFNIEVATADHEMDEVVDIILVKQSAPILITLPQTLDPSDVGKIVHIKDALGISEEFPITITAGPTDIDGFPYIEVKATSPKQNTDMNAGNFIVEEDFASVVLIWVGTYWNVI